MDQPSRHRKVGLTDADIRLGRFQVLLEQLMDTYLPIDHPEAAFWNALYARMLQRRSPAMGQNAAGPTITTS